MALFARHETLLHDAIRASRARAWWSAYPETPKAYAETKAAQDAEYAALGGTPFAIEGHPEASRVGDEASPFGGALGITYPAADADALVAAAQAASAGWAAAGPRQWVGVCLEILFRLNANSQLIAHAVQHTTGQAPPMAFQAGGPHAQERGLEAVAYAWEEMTRQPDGVRWEKPTGRSTLVLDKTWRVVPRGVGLVIGCNTFPTWNSYPGLFASLATGNAVIAKPHPHAILPLALTVRIGREVLREAGFDPDVLLLAADTPDAPIAKQLAAHPGVGIVDYTGGNAFGAWLRRNASGLLYTEEAGANPVVIHATSDFGAMCHNLAFSLSLYSGQMCTAPQNLFVPAGGIDTDQGPKSFDQVAAGIADAVDGLLSDPGRAAMICGAIAGQVTLDRVAECRGLGQVIRDSAPLPGDARTATPADPGGGRRRRCRLERGALRPHRLPDPRAGRRRRHQPGRGRRARPRRDHRRAVFHRRSADRPRRGRVRQGRGGAVGEPAGRHLREPVGRLVGLPRQRPEPGRQRLPDRRRVRGGALPRGADAPRGLIFSLPLPGGGPGRGWNQNRALLFQAHASRDLRPARRYRDSRQGRSQPHRRLPARPGVASRDAGTPGGGAGQRHHRRHRRCGACPAAGAADASPPSGA